MKLKRIKLSAQNRLVVGLISLIIGVTLGIATTTVPLLANFTLPKLAFLASRISPQQAIKIDASVEKKQKLEKFYNEISTASDKKDWAKLYELVPQSVRNGVSKSEFIAYYSSQSEKNKIVSEQTKVNSIQVNGDKGIVDRTRIICTSKECTGDNRKEENAKREYVYVDGKWQMPDPKPSERALKAATFDYYNESPNDQKTFIENWGYGVNNENFAIKQYALFLDSDLTSLISEETRLEKFKTDQANKPKVIYQTQPAPVFIDSGLSTDNSFELNQIKDKLDAVRNCQQFGFGC